MKKKNLQHNPLHSFPLLLFHFNVFLVLNRAHKNTLADAAEGVAINQTHIHDAHTQPNERTHRFTRSKSPSNRPRPSTIEIERKMDNDGWLAGRRSDGRTDGNGTGPRNSTPAE